ncbi:arrestin red cell-like isoform X2 [Corticium candelabrum]|uniref:arrestin red cell-like isoform X2 n=1 Tax=Corticium candelabrum TaxID=121492 RepID=UPI002E25D156|nr:arrestin red cell-like isoform X2 [Corticium candelabrum]XP_062522114.1 arrestin red cell-like isoform X2 [Corticium candelabrum]
MAAAITEEPSNGSTKTPGTRVYKKCCPNNKITVYVGKRDFIDHNGIVDALDGVVRIDSDCIEDGSDKKVFVQVLAAFRHGREDLDVLGLSFRKDLFEENVQIYPVSRNTPQVRLSKLQERLIRKLGADAYPFTFKLPACIPSSVTLQPEAGSTTKPCGIDFELRVFVANEPTDKADKRNLVRLVIKKLTHASQSPSDEQPTAEVSKPALLGGSSLQVEATLDKRMYCHGEEIKVHVSIQNRTGRPVKKIKVSARQFAEICLFSTAKYKCVVDVVEAEERILQGNTFHQTYTLCPTLQKNRDKRGLALDGQLKHEDTNLASSTVVDGHVPTSSEERQCLGIVVEYRVKVRCVVALGRDVTLELPFILSHPKSFDPLSSIQDLPQSNPRVAMQSAVTQSLFTLAAPILGPRPEQNGRDAYNGDGGANVGFAAESAAKAVEARFVEGTLILVDDTLPAPEDDDDELVFEEFVRSRVHGGESEA